MKQLSFVNGRVSVVEVPPPMCGPAGVLIQVSHSLISTGTEMAMTGGGGDSLVRRALTNPDLIRKVWEKVGSVGFQQTAALIRARTQSSLALGYSAAGRIVDVGAAVTRFRVGDRVACAGAGYANHAEFDFVPQNLAAAVPDAVDDESAAFATLGAIALHGVRRLAPTLGEQFVVIGLGLLGQITAQVLRIHGCRVFGVDLMQPRLQLARKLGMEAAIQPGEDLGSAVRSWTGNKGADGVVVCASGGDMSLLNRSFDLCRPKGRVVLVGDVPIRIGRDRIYRKELDFFISCSYGPGRYDGRYEEGGLDYPLGYVRWTEGRNLEEVLRLIGNGSLDVRPLIDGTFRIDDAPSAYARFQEPNRPIAVLIDYGAPAAAPARPTQRAVVVAPRPAASGKVRLGVIGAGAFFKSVHLPNLQKIDAVQLRTLVSRTGLQLKDLALRNQVPTISTDPEDVFTDPDIDAVLISTRHDLHIEYVRRAVAAGKHVFVEKPLGLSSDDCRVAVDEAGKAGVLLTVGFNRRFSPHARRLKESLASTRGPRQIVYRVNAGVLPGDHWLRNPLEGGGRVLGEGVHFFDFITWLADAEPRSVSAVPLGPSGSADVDSINATVTFQNGSIGMLAYAGDGHGGIGKERVEVFGGGASMVLDDFRTLDVRTPTTSHSHSAKTVQKGHLEILDNFCQAVLGKARLEVTGEDGYWATWCAERALYAAGHGR